MSLEQFVHKIEDFDEKSISAKIDYFIYFHTIIIGNDGVKSRDIDAYYEELKLPKYSNISQYLSLNTRKNKNKSPKLVLQKGLYHLQRTRKSEIEAEIKVPKSIIASNDYFPLEILNKTREYLVVIGTQAVKSYDNALYDACSVMTRKLLEILIIEAFERHRIESKIQNSTGNFYYLSDLIDRFLTETAWNVGRNAKSCIPNLKKLGDLSAHNRRYIARKGDVDKVKGDLRIVLEELIHIIDYPTWNKIK